MTQPFSNYLPVWICQLCCHVWSTCQEQWVCLQGSCDLNDEEKFVCLCFEPSQPQRIMSGLKTNFNLSPCYCACKSSNHKFSKTYKLSLDTNLFLKNKNKKNNSIWGIGQMIILKSTWWTGQMILLNRPGELDIWLLLNLSGELVRWLSLPVNWTDDYS